MQPSSEWRISIGSSIVTMCCRRVRLMWPSIDASVVVFPTPVAPVTRMRPRFSSARFRTPCEIRSESNVGTSLGITRNANEMSPRCRKALTRNRGSPAGW